MEDVELNIIEFKEGKFFFNKNIEYTKDLRKNIRLDLRPELIYKQGSDVAYIRLASIYYEGEVVLMSYDMSLGFIIKGWSESIAKTSESELRSHDALQAMIGIMIGFCRGAMAVHAKGSELENVFFPFLNIDEFASNINLRVAEDQKNKD